MKRLPLILLPLLPAGASASESALQTLNALDHPLALLAVAIFVAAYALVIFEEVLHLPKSKPMLTAAGLLWVLAALLGHRMGIDEAVLEEAVLHNLAEYASLLLFLLVAMVYINALEERNVFEALKGYLISRGLTYRQLFWVTGVLAFFLSPVADNLTTALIMGAVIMALGKESPRFISLSCISIVVAANAGGAFSPFGDITTLMVWQSGNAEFAEFLRLFLPSVVNYLIPALILFRFIPPGQPPTQQESVAVKPGGYLRCALFLLTITLAVSFENILGLPPYLGMMSGLSLLFITSYLGRKLAPEDHPDKDFNVFSKLLLPEWDTLLFFFGVMYCVGALSFFGYLGSMSGLMYGQWGATYANIAAGVMSALIDNIPVMFAILTMDPDMGLFQWLLITLTAGVGGSLLSIGSAAGVALMGSARGHYTFLSHLRWSWAIALGYAASIAVHFLVNG